MGPPCYDRPCMGGRASRRRWWGAAALLGACAPNSGGVGTGGANTLGLPDDTGETTAGATADGPAPTSAPEATSIDSGMDPSGSLDDTTGPEDGTTTDEPPPATTGTGEAMLTISDGATYDFGDVPSGGQAQHVFTVTNQGDGDALGLGGTVGAPFGFPGGFPGGVGTCADTLGAGESCTVEVVFSPSQIGRHAGQLGVSHEGGGATRDLEGGAAGQTANLLTNPGGESSGNPPPGWTEIEGNWIAGVLPMESDPYTGAGYIYADSGFNNVDYSLLQDVDLGTFATTIDAGLLRMSFASHVRAYAAGDNEYRVRVHYLDSMGATAFIWTTDYQSVGSWQEYADTRPVPAGTRTVRVELNCRKNSGMYCNAYFDALDLHASYP